MQLDNRRTQLKLPKQTTKEKVLKLDGSEPLSYPTYSRPDFEPSDYHLFKNFQDIEEFEDRISKFYIKNVDWYSYKILILTERWLKITDCNLFYFEEEWYCVL